MSEEKHTPLPWRVEQGTDLIWGACNPDDDSTYGMGYPIVVGRTDLGSWNRMYPDIDERMANAARIVRSVNALPAIVKALEEIASTFDESWLAGSLERRIGDKARAALATVRIGHE